MAEMLPVFSLLIAILSACIAASCAAVFWKRGLPSISTAKKLRDLVVELEDLQSSLDSLTLSHRRLSARVGMRSKRGQALTAEEQERQEKLPLTKQEAREKYLNGKSPQQVAREIQRNQISTNEVT